METLEILETLIARCKTLYGVFAIVQIKIFSDGSGEIFYTSQQYTITARPVTLATFRDFKILEACTKALKELG